MKGAICGVSRGHYIRPVPISETNLHWTDEEDNSIPIPKKYPCRHEYHWKWGKGTRNGQKLYYLTKKMFWQKWHLTEEEMKAAVKNYDISSLEMRGRIICADCAEREMKNKH